MPDGEIAVALQVREIILGMPLELERIKRSVIVSDDNLKEYRKQLSAENPYSSELESSNSRLDEINRIIKERSKQEEKPRESECIKTTVEDGLIAPRFYS